MLNQIYIFINAIKNYYKNYFNFNGTADRPEFWYPFLYHTLIFVTFILIGEPEETDSNIVTLIAAILAVLYFANIIPTISVTVRRMHDTSRSGWKVLWGITFVGWIYLLICVYGKSRPNRWETSNHFEVSNDSKFCSNCGNEIAKHSKLCSKCDIEIDESESGTVIKHENYYSFLHNKSREAFFIKAFIIHCITTYFTINISLSVFAFILSLWWLVILFFVLGLIFSPKVDGRFKSGYRDTTQDGHTYATWGFKNFMDKLIFFILRIFWVCMSNLAILPYLIYRPKIIEKIFHKLQYKWLGLIAIICLVTLLIPSVYEYSIWGDKSLVPIPDWLADW